MGILLFWSQLLLTSSFKQLTLQVASLSQKIFSTVSLFTEKYRNTETKAGAEQLVGLLWLLNYILQDSTFYIPFRQNPIWLLLSNLFGLSLLVWWYLLRQLRTTAILFHCIFTVSLCTQASQGCTFKQQKFN